MQKATGQNLRTQRLIVFLHPLSTRISFQCAAALTFFCLGCPNIVVPPCPTTETPRCGDLKCQSCANETSHNCRDCPIPIDSSKESTVSLPSPVEFTIRWNKPEGALIRYWLRFENGAVRNTQIQGLFEQAAEAWTTHVPLSLVPADTEQTADIVVLVFPEDCRDPVCPQLFGDSESLVAGRGESPRSDGGTIRQWIRMPQELESAEYNRTYAVVLHEFGHNLGLIGHSTNSSAVMYAELIYDLVEATPIRLHDDDIARVQRLYGSRNGDVEPGVPTFATAPQSLECEGCVFTTNPDQDRDGLADDLEEFTTRTDKALQDTDNDGLSDLFELHFGLNPLDADGDRDGRPDLQEVLDGEAAVPPIVCDVNSSAKDVVLVTSTYLTDLGLEDGDIVSLETPLNGCTAADVTVRELVDSDDRCDMRMSRDLREDLCIYQLNGPTPISACKGQGQDVLYDFESGFRPPIVVRGDFDIDNAVGNSFLSFSWSFDLPTTDPSQDAFIVFALSDAVSVRLCDTIAMDLWVDRCTTLRIEAKTINVEAKDTHTERICPDGDYGTSFATVEVPISSRFPLGEIAIVAETVNNSEEINGTVLIDNIRVVHGPSGNVDEPGPDLCDIMPALTLFWVETFNSNIAFRSLSGSEGGLLIEGPQSGFLNSPQAIAIHPSEERIYWVDSIADGLFRANLRDGSAIEKVADSFAPVSITLDTTNSYAFFTECCPPLIKRVMTADISEAPLEISVDGSPTGIALDEPAGMVYWADAAFPGTIWRASMNGLFQEQVWPGPENQTVSSARPESVAIDSDAEMIFWTDSLNGIIWRSRLSGAEALALVTDLANPRGIAVDKDNQVIYWSDDVEDAIFRASYDGDCRAEVVPADDAHGISIATEVTDQ